MCTRLDEFGVSHLWFEPRRQSQPYTYVLFGEALDACRADDPDRKSVATQMALLRFASLSEMPPKFVEEAALNLSLALA